jgi:MFS family permease
MACVRFGDRTVTIVAAAAGSVALAVAVVPLVASTATASIVAGVALRALAVSLLYTISFPMAANGALRAGVGRGAALGLTNVGWGAATLIGPLVAGGLAETVGERVAYAGVIVLALATAGWLVGVERSRARSDGGATLGPVRPLHRP